MRVNELNHAVVMYIFNYVDFYSEIFFYYKRVLIKIKLQLYIYNLLYNYMTVDQVICQFKNIIKFDVF